MGGIFFYKLPWVDTDMDVLNGEEEDGDREKLRTKKINGHFPPWINLLWFCLHITILQGLAPFNSVSRFLSGNCFLLDAN